MAMNVVNVTVNKTKTTNVSSPKRPKVDVKASGVIIEKTLPIPTKLSEFINDTGYITEADLKRLGAINDITVKSLSEWEENSDYIPAYGEIIIITNYDDENNTVITVGDGIHPVLSLSLITSNNSKLNHSLTIGPYVYDGSEDVVVAIYDGEMTDDSVLRVSYAPSVGSMTMQNPEVVTQMINTTSTMIENTMMNVSNQMTMVNSIGSVSGDTQQMSLVTGMKQMGIVQDPNLMTKIDMSNQMTLIS